MSDGLPSSNNPLTIKESNSSDAKVVMDVFKNFYVVDENLSLITDISNEERACLIAIDAMDKMIKDDWGIDLKLQEDITTPFMALAVSIGRNGRNEGMEVMKYQLTEKRNNDNLKKLFGEKE